MGINGIIALSVVGGLVLIGLILLFCLVPMKTWFTALFSGAHIFMVKLTSMKLRKIKAMDVVKHYITAKKAKLGIKVTEIEAFYLAGGECERAISALIFAKSAKLVVDFDYVKALELSGQNSLQVLENVVKPKVIEVEATAAAQDAIELIVKAKATLQVNLEKFIGGMGEDTIVARLQKKIISNLALAPNHKTVLAAPQKILIGVSQAGIDEGCAYLLKSAEIVKVETGRDLGAELAAQSAQKDIALAQVETERMKSSLVMREQQIKARTEEMKSEVLAAEAEVPRAIAEAIKEGRFSIMDYYKLMNLQADTAMRRSIMNGDDDGRGE